MMILPFPFQRDKLGAVLPDTQARHKRLLTWLYWKIAEKLNNEKKPKSTKP